MPSLVLRCVTVPFLSVWTLKGCLGELRMGVLIAYSQYVDGTKAMTSLSVSRVGGETIINGQKYLECSFDATY